MSEETESVIETNLNLTTTWSPTISVISVPTNNNISEYTINNATSEGNFILTNFSSTTLSSLYFNSTAKGNNTTNISEFSRMTEANNITSEELGEVEQRQITQFWIGVGLSVASSIFIGASFIIKKKALVKLSKGGRRANQGGYGYLKDFLWWSGLLAMAVGEAANFMAYTFATASLISTLGVLSVLVTAILSSKYLHERLNFLGKLGCLLCTIGSTIIVIHAPMEKDIESMHDLQIKLTNFIFVLYVLLSIILSLILIYHFRPKLPETSTYTLLIWIGVCSMIGSLSVMSVKGLGLALMQTINGPKNQLGHWLTWFCLITLIICISVQMNFLNKALDTFNTAVVTPIYYVFFTTCVIIASAILFNEFAYLPIKDWVGLVCGFLTVLIAIFMLHLCKNFDVTLFHLTQQIDIVNDHAEAKSTGGGVISVREMDLKNSMIMGFKSEPEEEGDDDETDLEDMYKSCESKAKSSLTPDVKLLSPEGRRNREGYIPLSYGTTDDSVKESDFLP